jgi:hypothetical protein
MVTGAITPIAAAAAGGMRRLSGGVAFGAARAYPYVDPVSVPGVHVWLFLTITIPHSYDWPYPAYATQVVTTPLAVSSQQRQGSPQTAAVPRDVVTGAASSSIRVMA